jgi:DNA-directed RNA polymerase specialized sigma24 family protein
MKKDSQMTQEDFENLLGWFAEDREKAGEKYEQIRHGLVRFYRYRGCDEPESLTDETFNRVARKLRVVTFDENVKMNAYFYSFASRIYLEYVAEKRKKATNVELDERIQGQYFLLPSEGVQESDFTCLDECLAKLPPEDKKVILQYYSLDKKAKMNLRTNLAEEMNLKMGALHTRVHRIRVALRNCVEKCLAEKDL